MSLSTQALAIAAAAAVVGLATAIYAGGLGWLVGLPAFVSGFYVAIAAFASWTEKKPNG